MTNKIDFTKFDLESYVNEFATLDAHKSVSGNSWYKCCFHEEKSASLHVTDKQAFYCHGCGVQGGILEFVKQVNDINTKSALDIIVEKSGQESVIEEYDRTPQEFFAPDDTEKIYSYNGGWVLKYRRSSGKYIWTHFSDGKWWVGTGNVEVGLYAPNGLDGVVVLAEGEKDADTLCEMGFNGASSPNGTYKWKSEYTESLKSAERIVILNDNDDPGIKGAMLCNRDLIIEDLIAKRISPLELENSDIKGLDITDVTDLIGLDETRLRLQELINSPLRWDRYIYNDEEILGGVSGLAKPNVEIVEVEIVEESGMGEEYDNLIQRAVQETMNQGDVSEVTLSELIQYGKKSGFGIKYLKDRIKRIAEDNKPKRTPTEMKSNTIKIKELDQSLDISGSGYVVSGKSGAIYDSDENEVLGHTLVVVGVVVDAETEQDKNVKIALAYNTPQNFNRIQLMVVPKKILASTRELVPYLSGYNINVTQVNALQVVQYLQDLQNHFNEGMITMKSLSRFGWFEDKLMPFEQENSGIIFDTTVAQPVANKLTGAVGDKDISLELIQEIASHSHSAAVTIGGAVGSLVASYLNTGGNQSFAINLWGGTSTGKSVLCQGVSSMFGYPFKDGGWWGDGTATLNKDMYHNALLGNLPNFIDDPALNRQYDSTQKRDYIYTVTSGQSRGRMNRDGQTAQDGKTWNNVMIMTNETRFIDDTIADGGAKARCIEVFFDKVLQQETVNKWLDVMGHHYGHFAVDIANKIREIGKVNLDEQRRKYIKWFNIRGVDGKRAVNAATIMLGLKITEMALGIDAVQPEEWLVKQIRGSGELNDGQRAFIKLLARIEVSGEAYRSISDRDGLFLGSYGFAADGSRVVNIPYRTLSKYGKEDNYDADTVINWGYHNGHMVKVFDQFDKPIGVSVSNGSNTLKVIQVYYDWTGEQTKAGMGHLVYETVIT